MDENLEVAMCAQFLEASPQVPPTLAKVEELLNYGNPSLEEKQALEVELKLLPSSLRYEFLSSNSTYPMIVNAKRSAS